MGTICAGSAKNPIHLHNIEVLQDKCVFWQAMGLAQNIPEFRKAHGKEDLEFEVELRGPEFRKEIDAVAQLLGMLRRMHNARP